MRVVLPILLLTATAALAQPAPDKPFIFDALPRGELKSFQAPSPVTVVPPAEDAPRPLPEASFKDDRRTLCPFEAPQPVTIGPGPVNAKTPTPGTRMELGCAKPDAPKPPAKGVG